MISYIGGILSDPQVSTPALILIKPRNVTTSRTVEDVEEIARGFEKLSPLIAKIAIVSDSDLHYGNARMGIAFSNPAILKAGAFRTVDEAILFLTT
ncbi:hypothetical protein ACFSSA_08570 [Luteolibacter algae]|uniref:STAS/SEC14 domain-containing protein n=1 Tax=Luteolibacter algae TaxID=454151 RepID=A0ABW5D782_9BACT